jgi:hypothetical protein
MEIGPFAVVMMRRRLQDAAVAIDARKFVACREHGFNRFHTECLKGKHRA